MIVGTAGSSIAASFGISVLIWQDLFGIQVQWLVMLMSVIILLAVGSGLQPAAGLPVQRRDPRGLKTGIIRSMARYRRRGDVAGLVFAATMAGMMFSQLTVLAQMGLDHRDRSAHRHLHRALDADAVDRDHAGSLVLVAPGGLTRAATTTSAQREQHHRRRPTPRSCPPRPRRTREAVVTEQKCE